MPTIIDSLLVTLGLDAKDFKKNAAMAIKNQQDLEKNTKKSSKNMTDDENKLEAERKKHAKEMESRNKAMASGVNKLRNEALGLLAIFTAGIGIKDFITNTINSEASLSRVSKNLNITARELAEYKLANEQAGGSAEGMVAQLQQSAGDIEKLKLGLGPSEAMQAFFRYGGSSHDLKDGNTYLKARADIISKMYKTSPTKAVEIARAMGVSEDTFNLMKEGAEGIEKLKSSQSGLAAAQAANADRAEAFRKKFNDLKNTFSETGVNLLTAFMPALEKLVAYLKQFSVWVASHQKDINGWIKEAIKDLETFAGMVKDVAPLIVGMLKMVADGWRSITEVIKEVGAAINSVLPESWRDKIGELIATVLAKGGNEDAKAALSAPAASVAKTPVGATTGFNRTTNNAASNSMQIGKIDIHTQATDAAGISKSLGGALSRYGYVGQANTGLSN